MKIRGLLITFAISLTSTLAQAQFSDNPQLNRWLSRKPVIDSIEVVGNSFFPADKIKGVMFSRRGNILRAIKSERQGRVQRETIMRDTSEVKYLYLSSGFLAVKLSESFEPIPPDSNAKIIISINEGRRFFYEKAVVRGTYDSTFRRDLLGIAERFKPGKPLDPFALKQALYDFKSVLANKGYPYATADYRVDTTSQKDSAAVSFRYILRFDWYILEILRMTGVNNFDTSQVIREVTFRPGDALQPQSHYRVAKEAF